MQGGAIDYLLKPVVSEELEELLVKMRSSTILCRRFIETLNKELLFSNQFEPDLGG